MPDLAWSDVVKAEGPGRMKKPRKSSLAMIIDTGLGVATSADVVEISGEYIDHWKCGFGTSTFVRAEVLRRKLGLLAASDILTYPGGTLLEAAIIQENYKAYMIRAKQLGFSAVEISDGTILMSRQLRNMIIDCAIGNDLTVITEVGKKDPAVQPSGGEIAEQAQLDLEAGASWVVVEGRESGVSVGIYDKNGDVTPQSIADILGNMNGRADKLIWEAPRKEQQATSNKQH